MKIREYIHRYNYTYNPDGIYRAIKYMYTYWPDPKNTTHIREEYINVSHLYRFGYGSSTLFLTYFYNTSLCLTRSTNLQVTA